MGNTILAHVLFSCNQVNLNLDKFFSVTGHSHNINHYNKTNFTAKHLKELPDDTVKCILQLQSDGWFRVLQYKLSYCKWFNDVPKISNWNMFFNFVADADDNWETFYSNIKDETWPECNSIKDITLLPEYIQEEIKQNYQIPVHEISNETQLVEFLTLSYFDSLSLIPSEPFDAPVYRLSEYFDYKIDPLVQISKILNWHWDEQLSKQFYNKMLEVNARYLSWLDTIKQYHDHIINGIQCPVNLDLWEKALVIAKSCQTLSIDPRSLKWQDSGCFLEHDNAILVKLLQR